MQESGINVARNLRILETMKCSLLSDIAGLYEDMMQNGSEEKNEISERLSDIILTSYLLAKQLGIGYNVLEKKLEKKIRMYLLEEKADSLFRVELSELIQHLKS